jgi:hypothetical protein
LDDVLELLIKFKYIMRSPLSPTGHHLYGLSSYLVPRAKPDSMGRLIVDFSTINSLLESPSAVIPEITASLQNLQGKAFFTSLDLRYAYMALKLDEESRPLTTFLMPSGSYQWLSLPTGAANSPAYFTEAVNKIIHFEVVRNEKGEVEWEDEGLVKLKRSPLPNVFNYFDDIIASSVLCNTYEESVKLHFDILEEAIARLAFHNVKISVPKCEFCRSQIKFLGWYITRDFIVSDPKRIDKIKNFKFPENKKGIRAFLGLINSLRRVCNLDVIKQIITLTPLTSSKVPYKPNETHQKAFEELKRVLTSAPLFGHLINPKARKFLWVDAATSSGVLGAVLAQSTEVEKGVKQLGPNMNLNNEVHQYIYDLDLPYEPVKLYTKLPMERLTPTQRRTVPPNILPEPQLLGFTKENVHDSFLWSTLSCLNVYNCTLPLDLNEYRQRMVKKLHGVLANKLKDFTFKMDSNKYFDFLNKFKAGQIGIDKDFILVEALSIAISRPFIILSTLKQQTPNSSGIILERWL